MVRRRGAFSVPKSALVATGAKRSPTTILVDGQNATFRVLHERLEATLHDIFRTAREKLLALLDHREVLIVFLRDPHVPLDNNASARILRGSDIARYNCFGSDGTEGARVAGMLFDVFATVRLVGLNPYTWPMFVRPEAISTEFRPFGRISR